VKTPGALKMSELNTKFVLNRKSNGFPKQKDSTFCWPMRCLSLRLKSPKELESCVFPTDYTSIVKPLFPWNNLVMKTLLQAICKKTVSVIDYKVLHDAALMKVNVWDA
jgi:hypothetical protein